MNEHKDVQLRDRETKPTDEMLKAVLARGSYNAYEALQEALPRLEIEQEWMWYTPHKAWYAKGLYRWTTSRGTKKEKVLYWLYVFDGYFCVAVWFKEKNRAEILKADLRDETKKMIREAETEMGMPTFSAMLKMTDGAVLDDIYALIECKKKLEL